MKFDLIFKDGAGWREERLIDADSIEATREIAWALEAEFIAAGHRVDAIYCFPAAEPEEEPVVELIGAIWRAIDATDGDVDAVRDQVEQAFDSWSPADLPDHRFNPGFCAKCPQGKCEMDPDG